MPYHNFELPFEITVPLGDCKIDLGPLMNFEVHPSIEVKNKNEHHVPFIKEVIFNEEGKTTIVIWWDDSKTVVHCGEGETFDRYTGFMACICKKMFGGTTTAKKIMNLADKKYQAALKAEKLAKEKAKHEEEAKVLKEKADKRRAKDEELLMEALVKHYLLEAEAKKRAEEILAKEEKP